MKLAAIATLYGRHDKTLPLLRRIFESSRVPDELWLMCEGVDDAKAVTDALAELGKNGYAAIVLNTPKTSSGSYALIPYSNKINWALERTKADAVIYVDNGSMPSVEKYRLMIEELENNPSFGAVYCTQKRTGHGEMIYYAGEIIDDAHGKLNYTQVMHRLTSDRWTTNIADANPDLADAIFWRSLHKTLGSFHPVGGDDIHDVHHISGTAAEGM